MSAKKKEPIIATPDIADDMYPNDSESMGIYQPDAEEDTAQVQEQHQMASAYPIMDELLAWFDEWLAFEKSNDSITMDDTTPDAVIARQLMVNKQIAIRVSAKKSELQAKFSAYKQAMNPNPGGDND